MTPNTTEDDELEAILTNLDQGNYLDAGGVEAALRDILSWHQSLCDEAVRDARLDEWSGIIETLHSGILAAEIHVHDIERRRIAELAKSKDKEEE